MADRIVIPFRHQSLILRSPWEYPDISDHFLIGGYSSGKTRALALAIEDCISRYWRFPVEIGIFAPTITFMNKVLIAELERDFIMSGTNYHYDRYNHVISIGLMKIYLIAIEQPTKIYGNNLSAGFVDELDELPQAIAVLANQAINERVRIDFPDGKHFYTVYGTTAQGFRGTYEIIQSIKEAGTGYVHIRGRTIDNTAISQEYYKKMYALYDENERLAFLEGHFVNLQAGRVYPSYSESECTVDDIQVMDDETVYVGQDLNIASSCATAMIKRDKILYVVKTFQFKAFGEAAKLIRQAFPNNEIKLFPDASGKMIIQGYTAEFEQYGIRVFQANSNPPVIERIFLVNKMLATGQMKRCRSCKDLDIAWKTRVYNEQGDPSKSKVHPAPDDHCDSHEYNLWSIVSNDFDYFPLYSLTRSYQKSQ